MHLVCMVQKKVLKSFSRSVMACFLSKCLWGLNTARLKVRTLAFQSANFSSLVLSLGSQTQQLSLIPPSTAMENHNQRGKCKRPSSTSPTPPHTFTFTSPGSLFWLILSFAASEVNSFTTFKALPEKDRRRYGKWGDLSFMIYQSGKEF